MTAPLWHDDAADSSMASHGVNARQRWAEAVSMRREWLSHGLSTQPADRATAQRAVAAIYARMSRPRPRFEWVDSPDQALARIVGLPTLEVLYRWIRDPRPPGAPPLASDLATLASRLRGALGARVVHADPERAPVRHGKKHQPWPELAPLHALAVGVPLGVVLHQGIRTAL